MRDSSPAVSVCIRASARPAGLLRGAIESVLEQTFTDLEVVVSDDSGRMGPVAEAFGDARIRYHANPRPAGSVANLRRVVGLARGQKLAVLDDDDLWLPEFLETAVEAFEHDPALGIVFTDHYLDLAGRRVARRPPLARGAQDEFLPRLLEHLPAMLSSSLVRREIWERGERDVPLQDRTVADLTIWLRATMAGCRFHYVDRPLAVWRQHPGQMTWSDELPARTAATLERFRFDDPACERLRRARLAEARLAQAGVHLRNGRLRSARFELARARRAAPGRLGIRGVIALTHARRLWTLLAVAHPRLLTLGARMWRRLRPPVVSVPREGARSAQARGLTIAAAGGLALVGAGLAARATRTSPD